MRNRNGCLNQGSRIGLLGHLRLSHDPKRKQGRAGHSLTSKGSEDGRKGKEDRRLNSHKLRMWSCVSVCLCVRERTGAYGGGSTLPYRTSTMT